MPCYIRNVYIFFSLVCLFNCSKPIMFMTNWDSNQFTVSEDRGYCQRDAHMKLSSQPSSV